MADFSSHLYPNPYAFVWFHKSGLDNRVGGTEGIANRAAECVSPGSRNKSDVMFGKNSHPGIDFPIPVDSFCEHDGECQGCCCHSGYFGWDENGVALKACVIIDGLTTGASNGCNAIGLTDSGLN